ncbi:uncharacterized protein LOC107030220 [Solanum pennellii]|uniref:Uncharacterized protein LOC107030220 n=1 Tax=Solanum pennellii TaxID=28526 RepID=A0ABM1HL35_SOLPN|nr:uncharacterized protein LOC107030220 [Solanum pennellii]
MNRTLLEKDHCMLLQANMSKEFWAEAVHNASHIANRSPASPIHVKILNEVWSGELSNYSYLRIFGCPSYYHINEGKLEPRAKKVIFVVCIDVTFDESSILDPHKIFMDLSRNENNEQVELTVELTKTLDQDTQIDESKDADLKELASNEQYKIAKGTEKRQIRKP